MSSYGNVTEFMYEYIQQLDIAGVCYEALCQYFKTQGIQESVVHWENTSAHTRAAVVKMVDDHNTIRLQAEAKNITFGEAHNKRVLTRAEEGWVFGHEYDAENKTDPSICVYEELPINIKISNELIGAIVKILTDPKYKTK